MTTNVELAAVRARTTRILAEADEVCAELDEAARQLEGAKVTIAVTGDASTVVHMRAIHRRGKGQRD